MKPPISEPFGGDKVKARLALSPEEWLCASGAVVSAFCVPVPLVNFVRECAPSAGESIASSVKASYHQNIVDALPFAGFSLLMWVFFFLLRSWRNG